MWQRLYASFHTKVETTLRALCTANSADSFSAAASAVLQHSNLPQQDVVRILQSLATQYTARGFDSKEAVHHLVRMVKQDFDIFAQIAALESLIEIAPQGKTPEFKVMLSNILTSLYASQLHEMTTQTSEKLLRIISNLRIRETRLFDYIKFTVKDAAFPQGVLTGSFLCSLLKAAADLNLDVDDLRELLIQSLHNRVKTMYWETRIHVAFYLSRIGILDGELWGNCLLPVLMKVNLNRASEVILSQLHNTLLAVDLLSTQDSLQTIQAHCPGYQAFRHAVTNSYLRVISHDSVPALSTFHQDVIGMLAKLGRRYQLEYITPIPTLLTVDIFLDSREIIEVQGPTHYLEDSKELVGKTVFKNRILRKIGFSVIDIPYFIWGKLGENEKMGFLNERLGRK